MIPCNYRVTTFFSKATGLLEIVAGIEAVAGAFSSRRSTFVTCFLSPKLCHDVIRKKYTDMNMMYPKREKKNR